MQTIHPGLDLTVAEALARYPALLDIFLKQHMGCVGCPMACFCSLRSAIELHHMNAAEVLQALEGATTAHPAGNPSGGGKEASTE